MEGWLQQLAEDGDALGDEKIILEKIDPSLGPQHVRDMLAIMEKGDNPQHPGEKFSDAKMGRWLGWAQAAVVAMGAGTLEEMKEINVECAD